MSNVRIARELELSGFHCSLRMRSSSDGIVVMRISGTDIGEFGRQPMEELEKCLTETGPAHLFIDARDVRGASMNVSGAWAEWLRSHRSQLRHISMLTGSRQVEVTAGFVRRFAALEDIMQVYTEPDIFEAALAGYA